jgi:hypothetical protein
VNSARDVLDAGASGDWAREAAAARSSSGRADRGEGGGGGGGGSTSSSGRAGGWAGAEQAERPPQFSGKLAAGKSMHAQLSKRSLQGLQGLHRLRAVEQYRQLKKRPDFAMKAPVGTMGNSTTSNAAGLAGPRT